MFSVVVPLFNKKKYVLRCVESILGQTFKDFELIVVDDGSTDGGVEELAGVSDSRFHLLKQENAGVSAARNVGIENSNNKWIAFIDADDAWLDNHLYELKKIIDLHPGAGLVATRYLENFSDKKIHVLCDELSKFNECDYFLEAANRIGVVCSSAVAVNRSAVNVIGGFRNFKRGEDLELWARLALDYPVVLSSRVTAIYYRGTGGVMDGIGMENNKIIKKIQLKDISPSVSMLVDCMSSANYFSKRASIISYINSRVFSAIRSALYRGNVPEAKLYAKLLLPPLALKLRCLTFICFIPNELISVILIFFKFIKKMKKAIQNFRVN